MFCGKINVSIKLVHTGPGGQGLLQKPKGICEMNKYLRDSKLLTKMSCP